jgi:hypothetical protein
MYLISFHSNEKHKVKTLLLELKLLFQVADVARTKEIVTTPIKLTNE